MFSLLLLAIGAGLGIWYIIKLDKMITELKHRVGVLEERLNVHTEEQNANAG